MFSQEDKIALKESPQKTTDFKKNITTFKTNKHIKSSLLKLKTEMNMLYFDNNFSLSSTPNKEKAMCKISGYTAGMIGAAIGALTSWLSGYDVYKGALFVGVIFVAVWAFSCAL